MLSSEDVLSNSKLQPPGAPNKYAPGQITSDSVVQVKQLNVTNVTKNTNCEMLRLFVLCDFSNTLPFVVIILWSLVINSTFPHFCLLVKQIVNSYMGV